MSLQNARRDRKGRYAEHEQSAPEISLAAPLQATRAVYDLYRQASDPGADIFLIFAEINRVEDANPWW